MPACDDATTHHGRTFLPVGLPSLFVGLAFYASQRIRLGSQSEKREKERVPVNGVQTLVHEEGDSPHPVHPIWWSGCTRLFREIKGVIVQQSDEIYDDETQPGEGDLRHRISLNHFVISSVERYS